MGSKLSVPRMLVVARFCLLSLDMVGTARATAAAGVTNLDDYAGRDPADLAVELGESGAVTREEVDVVMARPLGSLLEDIPWTARSS
jgi:hypothetical protein